MYASQIRVDPNDDRRIYMVNAYSFSDDGGKTFTVPRQSLHGDDRVVWINPRDSRHVIKGDDGGIGISYDRGLRWLYVSSLPVSQFYRIDADMQTPYWVYGGLQDNGSWAGPSATYTTGRANETAAHGGGDGFQRDRPQRQPHALTASGLAAPRHDLGRPPTSAPTRRPVHPGRRNWTAWGRPDVQHRRWQRDGARQLGRRSSFRPTTRRRSMPARTAVEVENRGDTWVSLGDRTTASIGRRCR
jgi:hypothetical protein